MKRILLTIASLGVGLVLAACASGGGGQTPPPLPPTPDEDLPLGGSAAHSYESGESRLYFVPSGTSSDIVHVEASEDVRLEIGNASLIREFSAGSSDFFGAGSAGFGSATLPPAAITEERVCSGSCVVFRPFGDFYVQVTNDSGAPRSIQVSAFGASYRDGTETFNDDIGTAPGIPAGGFDKGAIETVGDVDYWDIPATAHVIFTPQDFPTEADVVDAAGNVLASFSPGQALPVFGDEYVRVRAVDPERAAIVGLSGYTLEHGNFPSTLTHADRKAN